MSKRDASGMAQLIHKLGLVSESHLDDVLTDLAPHSSAEMLLRALERKAFLTPWQSQKLLKGEKDGYFLGGYRLLYRIASGSFGRVFRADDPNTGVIVAIKVLRRRWSEQRRTIDLFEREGRVGLTLQHPNIVKVIDVNFDKTTHQYYIIMEFVEGGNLRDFLAIRKKLEPAEALRLVEDAASALAYAFSQGVTHRDIKPTNILIDLNATNGRAAGQGTAKLVDFGLAEICSSASDMDDDTKVYRTVDYTGLERATDVRPGDVRSDIFFLGCTLYEMLTGRSALIITTDKHARMDKERFLNIPSLRTDEVKAPPALFQLLDKTMTLNPAFRYQTPTQLLDAIRSVRQQCEGNAPIANLAIPPVERTVFIVEQNRRLQEALREAIKRMGYRVMLAADSNLALSRYRQSQFDALILDAGPAGIDGLRTFETIINEARHKGRSLAGVLLLSEDQAEWTKIVPSSPSVVVMVRPVTLGQVVEKLRAFVPTGQPPPSADGAS